MNFLKASLFNIISSSLLYLLHIATSIIQARVLGPTELGRFQLFVSTQTIIIALFSLGLGQASIYYRNNKKISLDRIVSTIFKAEFIIVLFIINIIFYIVFFGKGYFGETPWYIILIYAIGSASTLAGASLRPLLIADMQVVKLQLTQYITSTTSFAALVIIYIISKTLDVNTLIILTSATSILGTSLFLFYYKSNFKLRQPFDWRLFKSISNLGLKMSLNNIAFLCIQNAPIYIISWYSIDKLNNVGLYSRAAAVCAIATFVCSTVGPLLYSKFSIFTDKEKYEKAKIASSILLIINISITLFIVIFSKHLIWLLYGNDFLPATNVLRILSISLIFTGTNEIINNLLSSIGKPEYLLKNFIITLSILIPLLYIGISYGEIIGCAIAVVFTSFIKTVLLINSIKKFFPFTFSDFFLLNKHSIKFFYSTIKENLTK